MKLNIKKTGMIVVASSALLASNSMAEEAVGSMDPAVAERMAMPASTTFYGHFGIESAYRVTKNDGKSSEDATSLSLRDGGNRFGAQWEEGMIHGHLELGVGINGSKVVVRHANIKVNLPTGGTLGIGQQSASVISDGWYSNAWTYHDSALGDLRRVGKSRYTGISYAHDLEGKGSLKVMVGLSGADDGSGTNTAAVKAIPATVNTSTPVANTSKTFNVTAGKAAAAAEFNKKANNPIDRFTLHGSFKATSEFSLEASFDKSFGELDTDPTDKNVVALAVSYSSNQITGHLGALINTKKKGKEETKITAFSLNGVYDIGNGMSAFGGIRSASYSRKDNKGVSVANEEEREMAITAGINTTVWGSAAYAGINYITNSKGVKDDKVTDISAGLSHSF